MRKKRRRTGKEPLNDIVRLKDLVARANRVVFHEKLADYHGHVSARVAGTRILLIKPVLVSLDKIRSKDILALDIDEYVSYLRSPKDPSGRQTRTPFGAENQLAPGETILHLAIYEARPDVFSVVHTHQPLATAFGIANVPIQAVSAMAARNAPGTPILQNPQIIRTIEMAEEAARTLGQASALLLRSIEEATSGAVYLERSARLQLLATLLGKAAPIPKEFITGLAADMNLEAPVSFAYFESSFSK